AIDINALKADAAAIISRLSKLEQRQLSEILDRINSGNLSRFEQSLLSDHTAGRCDPLLGAVALREMAASDSPGLKWAAANLSPRQAHRAMGGSSNVRPALDKLAAGNELDALDKQILQLAIGGHPALEEQLAKQADADLVLKLATALQQSQEIERRN
ncbi:MAG: hypothetical protein H0T51_19160, partial [Pirellulales bacterium]|nr:hypothetical protein [Pirellulales bacterium]